MIGKFENTFLYTVSSVVFFCQKEIVLYVFLYIIILFVHKTFDIPTQIFCFPIDFKHFN